MLSSEGSFWEIGQFRRTVKRVDDGHRLCNDLMLLLQERSEIERKYSKSLKHWSKRWNELIDKGRNGQSFSPIPWRIVTEQIQAPDSSSDVSVQQNAGSISGRDLCVLLSKTLDHHYCALWMGRKAIGPVCCGICEKNPEHSYRLEKGYAQYSWFDWLHIGPQHHVHH